MPSPRPQARAQARALRASGHTYDEIATLVGCSKSSVSLWVRDVPKSRVPAPGWSPGARARRAERLAARRLRARQAREAGRTVLASELGQLPDDVIILLGVVAYWCEGSKSKPWRPANRLRFCNTDLGLIRLFLAFLDRAPVEHGGPRFRLHIHESADVEAAKASWAADLGVPAGDFLPTVLKRHNPLTTRLNRGDGYRGLVVVDVLKSAALYRYVEDMAAVVLAAAAIPGSSNGRTIGFGPINGGSNPPPGA